MEKGWNGQPRPQAPSANPVAWDGISKAYPVWVCCSTFRTGRWFALPSYLDPEQGSKDVVTTSEKREREDPRKDAVQAERNPLALAQLKPFPPSPPHLCCLEHHRHCPPRVLGSPSPRGTAGDPHELLAGFLFEIGGFLNDGR